MDEIDNDYSVGDNSDHLNENNIKLEFDNPGFYKYDHNKDEEN